MGNKNLVKAVVDEHCAELNIANKVRLQCTVPPNHLLLDRSHNIGPFSRWELDKIKSCRDKTYRTSKILTLLYQQFSNLLISQRDMSGPRLGALSKLVIGGYIFGIFILKIPLFIYISKSAFTLILCQ